MFWATKLYFTYVVQEFISNSCITAQPHRTIMRIKIEDDKIHRYNSHYGQSSMAAKVQLNAINGDHQQSCSRSTSISSSFSCCPFTELAKITSAAADVTCWGAPCLFTRAAALTTEHWKIQLSKVRNYTPVSLRKESSSLMREQSVKGVRRTMTSRCLGLFSFCILLSCLSKINKGELHSYCTTWK